MTIRGRVSVDEVIVAEFGADNTLWNFAYTDD